MIKNIHHLPINSVFTPEAPVPENFVPCLYLPSYALLRVTFCVIIIESRSKDKTVFCELEWHALKQENLHDQEISIFYEIARIKADQVRTVFYFCSFYKTPWQLKIEFPNRQLSMTTFFPSFRENFLTFPRPLSAGNADKTTHKWEPHTLRRWVVYSTSNESDERGQ